MAKKITRVVVIGGGFAGVKTALNLANRPEFRVQLISDHTHFQYHGALYRSAVGHSPKEVVIPLKTIFEGSNVEVILDSAGYIDPKKRYVLSSDGEAYPYDQLVIGLGNTVNYFGINGLSEHTESMHDIASTLKLRRQLVTLFSQPTSSPKRVVIVGAGASGVELAGELPHFADLVAQHHNLPTPPVKIILVDGADRVLPGLSAKASKKAARRLHALGVELHLGAQVESCQSGRLCLRAGDLKADVLVWTAGSKPVDFFNVNSAVFTLGRGGRVVVDEYLRATPYSNIFVLGDNADTKWSGMAQTALYDASFVSRNLVRLAEQKAPLSYKPHKPLYVVTVGPKWAVVEKGKQVMSGRRGWRIRRQADLTIFKNFEPYKQAIKTWRAGNKLFHF